MRHKVSKLLKKFSLKTELPYKSLKKNWNKTPKNKRFILKKEMASRISEI